MPNYFGERIRAARKAAHLTQKQLADILKVKNTTISNWEKSLSRPDPDDIENICSALNIEPNYLFCIESNTSESKKTSALKTGRDASEILFALSRGGEKEITDEMFDEVKRFAAYVAQREDK